MITNFMGGSCKPVVKIKNYLPGSSTQNGLLRLKNGEKYTGTISHEAYNGDIFSLVYQNGLLASSKNITAKKEKIYEHSFGKPDIIQNSDGKWIRFYYGATLNAQQRLTKMVEYGEVPHITTKHFANKRMGIHAWDNGERSYVLKKIDIKVPKNYILKEPNKFIGSIQG